MPFGLAKWTIYSMNGMRLHQNIHFNTPTCVFRMKLGEVSWIKPKLKNKVWNKLEVYKKHMVSMNDIFWRICELTVVWYMETYSD